MRKLANIHITSNKWHWTYNSYIKVYICIVLCVYVYIYTQYIIYTYNMFIIFIYIHNMHIYYIYIYIFLRIRESLFCFPFFNLLYDLPMYQVFLQTQIYQVPTKMKILFHSWDFKQATASYQCFGDFLWQICSPWNTAHWHWNKVTFLKVCGIK